MAKITDEHALEAWLKEVPAEFACVLAARAALRVAPVLGQALGEEQEERRRALVMPSFRALAAANFAGAWPTRLAEVRIDVRNAGREAGEAVAEIVNAARMSAFEAKDAIPEMQEYISRLEADARSLGIAESAVDAATYALQAAVDAVDADKGIASPDAVSESCVSAASAACNAIDGVNGYSEFLAQVEGNGEDEAPVAAHVTEFWQAVDWDARFLQSGAVRGRDSEELVTRLSQSALWPERIPVWAGRRWRDFKEELPEAEGWSDWIDWYEGRLKGRSGDEADEFARVRRANVVRRQEPGHDSASNEEKKDRYSVNAARAEGAHEAEDKEKRYYTDDEFRSYVTASQLKRLPRKDQIAHMVEWFHRMYEDPVHETPYDGEGKGYLYIWGGPFNARDEFWDEFGDLVSDEVVQAAVSEVESDGTLDWAPTSSNPKHTAERSDEEEDEEDLILPTLDEIRGRLSSGVIPRFGNAGEVESREALRSEIAELRGMLKSTPPPHAGIGHNQPPEPLALSVELKADVTIAIEEMDAELTKPSANVDVVVERSGLLAKALRWVAQKADKFVDGIVVAAGAAVVADLAGIPVWENVARVYEAALRWLDAVTPLF